jgi:hypothetical protein
MSCVSRYSATKPFAATTSASYRAFTSATFEALFQTCTSPDLSLEIAIEIPRAYAKRSSPVPYCDPASVNVTFYESPIHVDVGSFGVCTKYAFLLPSFSVT